MIDVDRFIKKYMEQARQGIGEYLYTEDDDISLHYGYLYTKKLKDIRLAVVYKCMVVSMKRIAILEKKIN